jgi:hypothetical protein
MIRAFAVVWLVAAGCGVRGLRGADGDVVVTPIDLTELDAGYAAFELGAGYRVQNHLGRPVVIRRWNVEARAQGLALGPFEEPTLEVPAGGVCEITLHVPLLYAPEDAGVQPLVNPEVLLSAAPLAETATLPTRPQKLTLSTRFTPSVFFTDLRPRPHDDSADVEWSFSVTNSNAFAITLDRAELQLTISESPLPKTLLTGPIRIPPTATRGVSLVTRASFARMNVGAREALKYRHEMSVGLTGVAWFEGHPVPIDSGTIFTPHAEP